MKFKSEAEYAKDLAKKLEPMGDLALDNNYILKDGKKFVQIKDGNIHLLEKSGEFVKIDAEKVKSKDLLLKAATESYWIATGKI